MQYCSDSEMQEHGLLKGTISIGPICPVATEPPLPACLPTAETYKAYRVGIWTTNGRKIIGTLDPELDGSYATELMAGTYLINLVDPQKVGGSNLPVQVTINGSGTTILDINIDTGIR